MDYDYDDRNDKYTEWSPYRNDDTPVLEPQLIVRQVNGRDKEQGAEGKGKGEAKGDPTEGVEPRPVQVMFLSTIWIVIVGFWKLPGMVVRRAAWYVLRGRNVIAWRWHEFRRWLTGY